MELSDRKLKILRAIIDDYIDTGIPVGSRTLSKKPDFNYSSATIRNEMADLEEMGYLYQPHASAGRTPSDLAYRLYVDTMMHAGKLTSAEMKSIRAYFGMRMSEMGQVLDAAARALSEMTNHISLVTAPQLATTKLKRIQIVKITDTKAVLVMVTDGGLVTDTVINIPASMDMVQFERLSNMLTEQVQSASVVDAAQTIRQKCEEVFAEHQAVVDEVFHAIDANTNKNEVVLGGARNIFNYPEYQDIGKAQHFLQLLETKDALYQMISNARDLEFTIRIGHENPYEDFRDVSVVTATYKVGGEDIGSFGVIGPTRMDYAKVISVLHYVGMSMNDILNYFLEKE